MSDISKMTDKQLRNEVQLLRDELAIMKRKYEDIIYNLDTDNFSSRFVKEQGDMKTAIKVTAEGIESKVSKEELDTFKESTLTQTADLVKVQVSNEISDQDLVTSAELQVKADEITSNVRKEYATTSYVSSEISQTNNSISAVIRGEYTDDILNNYLTGIKITPNNIKMIATNTSYSIFSNNGLRFYDSSDDVEGWSVEPDIKQGYGGVLNYYVNGGNCYTFGTGVSKLGASDENRYYETDMVLKALNGQRGSFVVDVSESANRQIKFFVADWSDAQDTPRIMANGQLLATQNWVLDNVVARFG